MRPAGSGMALIGRAATKISSTLVRAKFEDTRSSTFDHAGEQYLSSALKLRLWRQLSPSHMLLVHTYQHLWDLPNRERCSCG